MTREFRRPNFQEAHIEFRCEEGGVSVYATDTGLRRLIALCQDLLDHPRKGHIHLEDYEMLTPESLRATLAVFAAGK